MVCPIYHEGTERGAGLLARLHPRRLHHPSPLSLALSHDFQQHWDTRGRFVISTNQITSSQDFCQWHRSIRAINTWWALMFSLRRLYTTHLTLNRAHIIITQNENFFQSVTRRPNPYERLFYYLIITSPYPNLTKITTESHINHISHHTKPQSQKTILTYSF